MNGKKIAGIIILVILALVLIMLMCFVINGGWGWDLSRLSFSFKDMDGYARSADYSTLSEEIDEINLDLSAETVIFQKGDGKHVRVEEKADKSISKDEELYFRAKGGVLSVVSSANASNGWRLFQGGADTSGKTVIVTIPESFKGGVIVDNVSGDIKGEIAGELFLVEINTTSGDTDVTAENVRKVETDGTSGDVNLVCGGSDIIDINTVSGETSITALTAPRDIDIDSVSGSVTILLPKGSTVELDVDSVSGGITNVFGDTRGAETEINADSVSGSIAVGEN